MTSRNVDDGSSHRPASRGASQESGPSQAPDSIHTPGPSQATDQSQSPNPSQSIETQVRNASQPPQASSGPPYASPRPSRASSQPSQNSGSKQTAKLSHSRSSSQASRPRRKKRRNTRLWVPQYHGAWAMVTIPPLVGVIEGGFRLIEVLVFALWFVGYFLFYSATVWLKSR